MTPRRILPKKINRTRPQGRVQLATPKTGRWASPSGARLGRIAS